MTDVFVSYSRRDIDIVSGLCEALRNRGKTVFIDVGERLERLVAAEVEAPVAEAPAAATTPTRSGVPESTPGGDAAAEAGSVMGDHSDERERAEVTGILPSTQWMDEIRAAIAAADNIVVVISPDSCASTVCRTELDYAVELSKRLIPVMVRNTPTSLAPASLRAINWLPIDAGPSFDTDVDQLAEVLDTDVDGLHLHTRLTVRAREWDAGRHDKSLLLRGQELALAEKWLGAQAARKPTPTSAQTAYILASRAAATRRQRAFLIAGIALALLMAGLTSVSRRRVAIRRCPAGNGGAAA